MSQQSNLDLAVEAQPNQDRFVFEPIKGYPMLNWRGKRPFTSTAYYPAQLKEQHGKPVSGVNADGKPINNWLNKIFWGDNLQVMAHLLKEFRGKVDLVYIDPPFDSKADYKKKISVKSGAAESSQSAFEEKQYTDIWINDDYLQFMYERIVFIKELLGESGAVYLHCDYRKSHHLKCILDEVFGSNNFINEIIWLRTNAHNMKAKGYGRSNDHVLFYAKGSDFVFNEIYDSYGEAQLSRYKTDEKGRLYKAENMTFSTVNPERQFEWRGAKPPANRSWGYSYEDLERLFSEGRIILKKDGVPRMDGLKVYLDEMKGNPLSSNWDQISRVGNTSAERTEYPTQKPEQLLERIITASSNAGSLIFDCFMGSGTTQAVAMKLGRRFIGADINLGAIQTTTKRLIKVAQSLDDKVAATEVAQQQLDIDSDEDDAEKQQPTTYYTGFEVYNVNHYDVFRNPVQAKELLIEALGIQKIPNSIYDGEKDGRMVKIMPINRIATRADLGDLISGVDYKTYEQLRDQNPNKPVEKMLLVCMGHDPDLAASLKQDIGFKLDVEIVDILRDKTDLQFKRESEAKLAIQNGQLVIERFYPMNLLQKLSQTKETVDDWREMVESVMIDWNYDGGVFQPSVTDIPGKNDLVIGCYDIPEDAGKIRVKITDLLSESWEGDING